MITSDKGIELIKQFEPLRKKAQRLNNYQWCIGYKHIDGVKAGDTINQPQAERLLRADLIKIEQDLSKIIKTQLTQQQFDAIVSFAFSEGIGILSRSILLQQINKLNFIEAAKELYPKEQIDKHHFTVQDRRRLLERKLFES